MASLVDVTMKNIQTVQNTGTAAKSGTNAPSSNKPELSNASPQDSFELSTKKKQDKDGFFKVAMLLGAVTALAGGGTYGAVKYYDKYMAKLKVSGIKKGEINEALYNFIKRIDPKGRIYHSREDILKINSKLTDDNIPIFKQLAKMKDENVHYADGRAANRFCLGEIADLMTNTNESNIKYLTQLAKKQEDKYGSMVSMTSSEIINVLKEIKPQNEKVAGDLIEKAGVSNVNELIKCLKDVKKENIDYYSLLLSTRRKSGPTELSFDDMKTLAAKLKETQNPKAAEFFINAEKHDGTGNYRHDIDELKSILSKTTDEKYDIYKQLYELECTYQVKDMKPFIENVTKDNIDVLEPLLKKEVRKWQHIDDKTMTKVFDDYNDIGEILGYTTEKNAGILKQVIELVDSKYILQGRSYDRIDVDKAVSRIMFHASTDDAVERATVLLNKGKSGESQTLTFKEFYDTFCGFNYSR